MFDDTRVLGWAVKVVNREGEWEDIRGAVECLPVVDVLVGDEVPAELGVGWDFGKTPPEEIRHKYKQVGDSFSSDGKPIWALRNEYAKANAKRFKDGQQTQQAEEKPGPD